VFSRFGPNFALLSGGALATAGWAAVFPFLYADISTARGLGAAVAAATFTAFAVGSILAAPVAGLLADTFNPARVAVGARLGLALFTAILAVAHSPVGIWLAALGFGASLAINQPAIGVLLLARTAPDKRREVFAWQFVALNLGTAAGAAVGGLLVNLSSQATMRPLYEVATLAALLSTLLVPGVRDSAVVSSVGTGTLTEVSYRAVLASRPVRWLLAVALLITLACYAQYDSGLPAYLLSATSVSPAQLGGAVAVNAVLVAVLTAPVVALTRSHRSTSLLMTCAALWVVCWLVFALPLVVAHHDVLFMFVGFAAMSFGETMMAPILSALAAALAPVGAVGRTMAAVTGASTIATAIGPVFAGALIGLHLPAGFIAMQIAFCFGSMLAARQLSRLGAMRAPRLQEALGTS
jgi:MFS family permease